MSENSSKKRSVWAWVLLSFFVVLALVVGVLTLKVYFMLTNNTQKQTYESPQDISASSASAPVNILVPQGASNSVPEFDPTKQAQPASGAVELIPPDLPQDAGTPLSPINPDDDSKRPIDPTKGVNKADNLDNLF